MSRMLLYLDKPRQPASESNITEIFPIYELDYNAAIEAGVDITIDWDTKCTNSVNDCYAITLSSVDVNLPRYFSTNAPHQAWQEGSILKGRMSPYVRDEETGIYDLDTTYYNFESIPIGTRPDDWGTASNIVSYFMPPAFTYNGVSYRYKLWYNNRKDYTWDNSKQYYYDKNRAIIKQFYTENGYSFGCYCGGNDYSSSGSDNSPYCNLIGYSQGTDGINEANANRYTFTNPSGTRLSYTNGRSGLALNCSSVSTSDNANKANCLLGNDIRRSWTQVFFHMVYNDRDYYGVLGFRCSSFAEDAPYESFYGCAFTSEFWGDSIIAGGGGEGVWGDVSTTGGGNGSFNFVTNNRGDTVQTSVESMIGSRIDSLVTTMSGYGKHVLEPLEFIQVLGTLMSNDYISRFANYLYNPLSAVLAINYIPSELCAEKTDRSILTASGFNISEHINHANPPTFAENGVLKLKSFETLDFTNPETYGATDSFLDFEPYTRAVLHLPYIGELDLSVNAFAHGKLKVQYVCDNISGNCVAFVWCSDKFGRCTYKYTASGNCAYTLPLYADKQDGSTVGKLISSAVGLGGGVITGNPTDIIGGVTGLASGIIRTHLTPKAIGTVGAFGGNVGLIGDSVCWLELIRPTWIEPANYRQLNGIPSELSGTLYDDGSDTHTMYDGYTLVSEIHLENVDCTDNEKGMIESVLKRGVHIHSERYDL